MGRKSKSKRKFNSLVVLDGGTQTMDYRAEPVPITSFGQAGVDFEPQVYAQIELAARLPVAVKAAVLPDGHPGYALPIGGVIALDNAVSPSFVGYDIACRMTLTVLDLSPAEFLRHRQDISRQMRSVSSFGLGSGFKGRETRDHSVMDDPLWEQIPILRHFKPLAQEQLGSSGGGNHFFDALIGEVVAPADWMPLPVGAKFVAVITHSGSRGPGNQLAQYYQKVAAEETRALARGVPHGYEWLSLDSPGGQEYWQVMMLMGAYAQANHHLIHNLFLKTSKLQQVARWENHHNFAFLENGLVVHRKGATPAEKGRIGIIPGSSGTASYLVEGLGNPDSLNSSSHGAGRPRSRTASRQQHNPRLFQQHMLEQDILAIGVEPDETYLAYKDIEHVMSLQEGILVRTVARLFPSVVIMGGRSDDGD
jgi:tRNA-splicing ligase RtcB (3'-phosphate/5'-hydroxy nucleic acid ligase)